MKFFFYCLVYMGCGLPAPAQSPAVSGRLSSQVRQPWQAWMSPASLASIRQPAASLAGMNPYLADNTRQLFFFACMPFDRQGAALGVGRLAFEGYENRRLLAAYGRSLSGRLQLGGAVEYQSERFFDGNRLGRWKAVFNTKWQPGKLLLGLYGRTERGIANGPLWVYIDGTAAADLDSSLYIDFTVGWQRFSGWRCTGSFQYCFKEAWLLAASIGLIPFFVSYETGYLKAGWMLLVMGAHVPGIGWTPGVKIGFRFSNEKRYD